MGFRLARRCSFFSCLIQSQNTLYHLFSDFHKKLLRCTDIHILLKHPIAKAFYHYFRAFPIAYKEEHTHLTGALSADFIHHHLEKKLHGPHHAFYKEKIIQIYGKKALPIKTVEDIKKLIQLQQKPSFSHYLKILTLAKLILTDKETHF